ncbi:MAG: MarR family winged helix-turn-helix transcriptional regulator [Alphaproteobacteria bacterium]
MTTPQLELDRYLPYRLSVLSNLVSRAFAALYAERFDLANPEWRVLAVLGPAEPLSASEVCKRTAMDKVRVSRAVRSLLASGLIGRGVSADDKRRASLTLTARGKKIYSEIVPLAHNIEASLLETLSPEETSQLDVLLSKLQKRATELSGPGFGASPND